MTGSCAPAAGDPIVEHLLELRVEWDLAVVVDFAERDAEPEG